MSLAILVRVAVPALVALGLSAAYLIFRKSQPEDEHGGGNSRPSGTQFTDGTNSSRSSEGSQLRHRTSRSQSEAGEGPQLEECIICTEDRVLVELYPCSHRSMCENCVIKIISKNSRACPFCRRRIHGYRDA
ncbi:RNA-binding protein MEX3D [Elysia marginata]|uniref:RNA-binding protein MEX3D n=1 Tax=Elysia marginata TaxID=1093978 RepID=A0AAV4JJA8_9GAST|nr:RNA-binding protein MEX3D [Elysia marginata]